MNENRNKTRRSGKTSKQQKKKQSREVCEDFFWSKTVWRGLFVVLAALVFFFPSTTSSSFTTFFALSFLRVSFF